MIQYFRGSTRKPVAGAIQRSQNGREILVPERRDICADVEKEGTFEQNGGLRRGCHQGRMPDGTSGRSQERVCMGRRAIFRPGTAASPAAWLSIAFGISCSTVFVSKIVEHCPLPVRRVRTVEDKRSASGGTFFTRLMAQVCCPFGRPWQAVLRLPWTSGCPANTVLAHPALSHT